MLSLRLRGLPPCCLMVMSVKKACLFLLASNEDPGGRPASKGCFAGLSVREIKVH